MSIPKIPRKAWVLAGLVIASQACGLKNPSSPGLFGPASFGYNLKLTASPSLLTADNIGGNSSLIQVQVLDEHGQGVPGLTLYFAIFDPATGQIVGLGSLSNSSGVTNGNGVAQIAYYPPARTDFTANGFIDIGARVEQGDANNVLYHFVEIELRSAIQKQFPDVPGRVPLQCSFTTEPHTNGSFQPGEQVLFADASADPNTRGQIIRYEWDFGDGNIGPEEPEVNHAYGFTGTFTVLHAITDSFGVQASCTQSVNVCDSGVDCPTLSSVDQKKVKK